MLEVATNGASKEIAYYSRERYSYEVTHWIIAKYEEVIKITTFYLHLKILSRNRCKVQYSSGFNIISLKSSAVGKVSTAMLRNTLICQNSYIKLQISVMMDPNATLKSICIIRLYPFEE